MAAAPQAGGGAGTVGAQPTAMQTEHVARGGRRVACSPAETMGNIRAAGASVAGQRGASYGLGAVPLL